MGVSQRSGVPFRSLRVHGDYAGIMGGPLGDFGNDAAILG